jgi:hypothetical protein
VTEVEGFDAFLGQPLRIMACHETVVGAEVPCVGWLQNQLDNDNFGLRLAVSRGRVSGDVETVGPQHECLADTFPDAMEDRA